MAHWSLTVTPRENQHERLIAAMNNNPLLVFLPLLIVLGAFMFFAARRRKRAMQATIDLHESLRAGDRVHTTSGLEATITAITDDTVDLEVAPGVVTTWMKLAIRDRIEPEDPEIPEKDVDDESMTASGVTAEADRPPKD